MSNYTRLKVAIGALAAYVLPIVALVRTLRH